MTESEWLSATDATGLWAFVRDGLQFNRNVVERFAGKEDDYNRRLLYLLGVAVCRRLGFLFPAPCCQRMIQIAEAYAEGAATLDELADAHEAIDDIAADEAASGAAIGAVFWLSTDEYKVIRGVDFATDAAGYLHAIAAGVIPLRATKNEGKAIWMHPAFLTGKEAEEHAVCDLIRDIFGNPFRPTTADSSTGTWSDALVVRLAQAAYDERQWPSGTLDNGRLAILADALEEAGCADADMLDHLRGPGPHVRGCWAVDLVLGRE